MTLPVYPSGDLDNPALLAGAIGSFWTDQFSDRDVVETYLSALVQNHEQAENDLAERTAMLDRHTIPVTHRQIWKKLRLLESQMNQTSEAFAVYGEGYLYGDAALRYGEPVSRTNIYIFPLPDDRITQIGLLFDRRTSPVLAWTHGVDFWVDTDRKALILKRNPFRTDGVVLGETADPVTGQTVREAVFQARNVEFDLDYLWNYLGYALQVRTRSTEAHRDFLNTLYDMHVRGPNITDVYRAIAAAAGVAIVEKAGTVELVSEGAHTWVVTDVASYRYPEGTVPKVAVGDRVFPGDVLVEGFDLIDTPGYHGIEPLEEAGLIGMVLGKHFLGDRYSFPLFFQNDRVPLEYVGLDPDGVAEYRFEVGGFPADVELFWDTVHAEGKVNGQTLGRILDQRPNGTTEPLPQHLPTQISPLGFILNFLANHLVMVRLDYSILQEGAPGLAALHHLRMALAPRMTFVVFVELNIDAEEVEIPSDHDSGEEYGAGADISEESVTAVELTAYTAMVEGVVM